MEDNRNKRTLLEDDMVSDVTGGTLKLFVTETGTTIKQYDVDFNVIGQYTVNETYLRNVYYFLRDDYWKFEAGSRDQQCLAYMHGQGWVY